MTTLPITYPASNAFFAQPFAYKAASPTWGGVNTQVTSLTAAAPLATLADGFPNVTMLPYASGGVPPAGQDFNGIFNMITQHIAWLNQGGQYFFNATLAASTGGYPVGAILQRGTSSSPGSGYVVCTLANNQNNPNSNMTGWADLSGYVNAIDYGADPTGVTDSTAAFTTAIAALGPGGGTIIVPSTAACYKMNLVITTSGVTLRFGGTSQSLTVPLGNYITAYNPALPVIQIGNATQTTTTTGVTLENVSIYGGGTCQYGLRYCGGAYYNYGRNIQIASFTTHCLEFLGSPVNSCFSNALDQLYVGTNSVGAVGIYVQGGNPSGGYNTSFCNGHTISNFSGETPYGYPVWIDGGTLNLTNGYQELGAAGLGVVLSQALTGSTWGSYLYANGVAFDSAAGPTAPWLTYDTGSDYSATSGSPAAGGVYGTFTFTGPVFINALGAGVTYQGTMSASSTSLTLSSATQVRAGRTVLVAGAGNTAGTIPLVAQILTFNASTKVATLSSACINASGVTNAATQVGNLSADSIFPSLGNAPACGNALVITDSWSTGLFANSIAGQMISTNGTIGAALPYPYNVWGQKVWDMGATGGMHFITGTICNITSISMSGTVATVTCSSNHGAYVGDLILISGANEAVNGTWAVASTPSATTLTYACTATAGTATLGTGVTNMTCDVRKDGYFANGYFVMPTTGIFGRDQSGNVHPIINFYNYSTQQQTDFSTADPVNGVMLFNAATTATTSATYGWLTGGGIKMWLNGYGALSLGSTNNADSSTSFALSKRAAGVPATNAAYGTSYVDNTTGSLNYVSPTGVVNVVAQGTATIPTIASASTIAPAGTLLYVSGTVGIATITPPYTGFLGNITIIPTGAFTTGTGGNIQISSTAVVGKALTMTYDGTKWYPSY